MPLMKEYRERLQPAWKRELDDIVEWTLLRPFSIYLSVPMGKLGLKPAHASALCFLSALAGSVLLASGDLGQMALGSMLVWLSFLLDCVDGELARYHGGGSWRGTYLDFLVGGINDIMIVVGLSCGVAVLSGIDMRWLVLLGAFLAGTEKLVDLYGQSVFYRYAEKLIADRAWQDAILGTVASPAPPKLTTRQKLTRAPFTTFGRVNIFVACSLAAWLFSVPQLLVAAYVLVVLLSFVYILLVFKKNFMENNVEARLAEKARGIGGVAER